MGKWEGDWTVELTGLYEGHLGVFQEGKLHKFRQQNSDWTKVRII